MLFEQITVCILAFTAGLVDAAVGGGGLVALPGLFAVLPHTPPAIIFGTNKFSSFMGLTMACWRYTRRLTLPWGLLLPVAGCAFVGALMGATVISFMPAALIRPFVLVLLVVMLVYTLLKKDFGQIYQPKPIGRRELYVGLIIGGVIGFYDGFFGPGSGSFLIFLFIRYFQFDFLIASAASKFINWSTNMAALIIFIPLGKVWYMLALPMAVCSIVGALVGTRLAISGGSGRIRKLFIVLVVIMTIKLSIDLFV